MAKVGIFFHPQRDSARIKAGELEAWLKNKGHHRVQMDENGIEDSLDLVVSLGGDGTMLRAIDKILHMPFPIPVLGVNFGSLGYLTECDPDGLFGALENFFDGQYLIDERMTLSIDVEKNEPTVESLESRSNLHRHYVALNDLVVEKLDSGHVIRVEVHLGSEQFLTYEADGLIISSPTGSTAYSFSARGPVVSPHLQAMILTPISPHMLFDRSLVLESTETVELKMAEGPPAAVMIDGSRKAIIEPGDLVKCSANHTPARLVTFSTRDFHQILKKKFGLQSKHMGD